MYDLLKKIWPLVVGLLLFIAVSAFAKSHLQELQTLLDGNSKPYGMMTYVLLGIATVIIPFGSVLPFIPIAVTLFGWEVTGILTFIAWVLGSQLLFEFSRSIGKPLIKRFVSVEQLDSIHKIVQGKGLLRSILIRMVMHGDIVSYGFGMFTHVNRWEFLCVTAIGVLPGAFFYAYFGSLPIQYEVAFLCLIIGMFTAYWMIEKKWPQSLAFLNTNKTH